MTVLIVIAILFLLIVVHELGHFIAAKFSKVKVEEFGVGYPPRAFTIATVADTQYTLNWIPFGGFVRLFGDEGEGIRGKGSVVDAPRWKQAIILVAGVTMNALMAWLLFAVALHVGVPQAVEQPVPGEVSRLIVTDIVPGSPASASGLQPGDEITAVTDERGARLTPLTADSVVSFVKAHGGKRIHISYVHQNATSTAIVTPANAVIPGAAAQPALGVALALVANVSESWSDSLIDAAYQTRNAFMLVANDLSVLVGGIFHGAPNLSGVVGPVGIVSYVGEASQNGVGAVLDLAALVSINLAIINLIPIPALDGGRLLVLAVEAATRRRAPRLIIQMLNAAGVGLIILLMLVITYHDIARLLA